MTTLLCSMIFLIIDLSATDISLPVTNATLYKQGVTVTRSDDVNLTAGKSTIHITDLPLDMDESTLNVMLSNQVIILSQKVERDYVDTKQLTSVYDDQKQIINDSIAYVNMLLEVLEGEQKILNSNISLTSSDEKYSATDVSALRANYAKEMRDIQTDILSHKLELRRLRKQLHDLNMQIAEEGSKSSYGSASLTLELQSPSSSKVKIELSYFHNDAGWTPTYDLRVNELSKPLNLVYKANIYQNTGEDWEDVSVSLSTARPNYNYNLPSTSPYFLTFNNYYEAQTISSDFKTVHGRITGVVTDNNGEPLIGANVMIDGTSIGTVTGLDGSYELYAPKGSRTISISYTGYRTVNYALTSKYIKSTLEEGELLDEVIVTGYSGAVDALYSRAAGVSVSKRKRVKQESIPLSLVKSQTSINYDLADALDLASTEEEQSVLIRIEEVAADYQYKAYPKIEKNAYLTAEIKDWSELQILEGLANIYIDNRYIGQTTIGGAREADDRYTLSLGQDTDVYVDRTLQKGYTRRKFVGSNKLETRKWKLDIVNNKSEAIDLYIEDQYPVSQDSRIKINLKEDAAASADKDKGTLSWNKKLSPISNEALVFAYEVKAPKDRHLIVE